MVRPLPVNPYIIDIAPFVDEATARRLMENAPGGEDKTLASELFEALPWVLKKDVKENYRGGGRCE